MLQLHLELLDLTSEIHSITIHEEETEVQHVLPRILRYKLNSTCGRTHIYTNRAGVSKMVQGPHTAVKWLSSGPDQYSRNIITYK